MDNTMNNGSNKGLQPPVVCPGDKEHIASKILDILYAENKMNDDTQFYEVCCGSGAVSLSLVNRGLSIERWCGINESSLYSFFRH